MRAHDRSPRVQQGLTSPRYLAHALLLITLGITAGCATTQSYSSVSSLQSATPSAGTNIAVMPLDVQLSILTAGGLLEPQAEWTELGRQYMSEALSGIEKSRTIAFKKYEPPSDGDPRAKVAAEIERLHAAVGQAILFHKYQVPLPTKKDAFDWTLGPDVATLKDVTGADYALFIFVRDSYSSAGRVFMQFAAAMLGVGIAGGQQVGFASLVDLNSGNIVWFNYFLDPAGDLRKPDPAVKTVNLLLKGLPE